MHALPVSGIRVCDSIIAVLGSHGCVHAKEKLHTFTGHDHVPCTECIVWERVLVEIEDEVGWMRAGERWLQERDRTPMKYIVQSNKDMVAHTSAAVQ